MFAYRVYMKRKIDYGKAFVPGIYLYIGITSL